MVFETLLQGSRRSLFFDFFPPPGLLGDMGFTDCHIPPFRFSPQQTHFLRSEGLLFDLPLTRRASFCQTPPVKEPTLPRFHHPSRFDYSTTFPFPLNSASPEELQPPCSLLFFPLLNKGPLFLTSLIRRPPL